MRLGEKFDPLVQWLARGAVKLVVCRLQTLRSLVRSQYGSLSFSCPKTALFRGRRFGLPEHFWTVGFCY